MTRITFLNKKALAAYEVLDKVEAGIVLSGVEVMGVREGKVNFTGSYITFVNEGPAVANLHIGRYSKAHPPLYNPERMRLLLLHKREAERLRGLLQQKGVTAVPLSLYFLNNRIKLSVGIVRGRKTHDKRELLKKRDVLRQMAVAASGKI